MNSLHEIFAACDQAFLRIAELHPEGVKCSPGCSDCCHAMFDCSLVEALAIRHAYLGLPKKERRMLKRGASQHLKAFERSLAQGKDPSTTRLRCPLLSPAKRCRLYHVRPVNCRTYGVPVSFQDASHVCPKSGFEQGKTYETLRLDVVHERLRALSLKAGGERLGFTRWPVGAIILDPGGILTSINLNPLS